MKKVFILLTFLLNNLEILSAQDSIDFNLEKYNTKEKAQVFNELAYKYLEDNSDTCILLANKAIIFAKQFNQQEEILEAYKIIAFKNFIQQNYSQAIENFKNALSISEKIHNNESIAECLNNIGLCYRKLKSEKSIIYYKRAFAFYEKLKDESNQALVLNNIGTFYYENGILDKSLEFFLKALKMAKSNSNKDVIAMSSNNLGNIYKKLNDWDKAIEQYNLAMELFREENNFSKLADVYNNMGIVHHNYEQNSKALEYYYKSLKIRHDLDNKMGIATTLNNIGDIYEKLLIYDSALVYYKKSLDKFYILKDIEGIALTKANIGNLFISTQKYDSAKYYLNASIELARKNDLPKIVMDVNFMLYDLYKKMGNQEKSISHFMLYTNVKDTLVQRENKRKINELLIKYRAEQQESDIELLRRENEIKDLEINRKQTFIISLISIIGLVIVIILIILNRLRLKNKLENKLQNRNEQLEKYSVELENEIEIRKKTEEDLFNAKEEIARSLRNEKELNELKTKFISMVSHEYRTPLTVVLTSSYLLDKLFENRDMDEYQKHTGRIRSAVDNMISLMNDVLIMGKSDSNRLEYHPKKIDIVEVIRQAVQDHDMIDKENHNFVFKINTETLDYITDDKILRQITDNLLSNAIKYSPEHTDIKVEILETDEDIKLRITDKGIGIPEEEQKHLFEPFHRFSNVGNVSGTGLGLSIVKRCVDRLKGKIFILSEENSGTRITVSLPK